MLQITKEERAFLRDVGRKISRIRNLKGLTLSDVATLCDCKEVIISGIEAGKKNFSVSMLKKLAEAFQVSGFELLAGF